MYWQCTVHRCCAHQLLNKHTWYMVQVKEVMYCSVIMTWYFIKNYDCIVMLLRSCYVAATMLVQYCCSKATERNFAYSYTLA